MCEVLDCFDDGIVKVNKIDGGWEIQFLYNEPRRITNKGGVKYLNSVIDRFKKEYEQVPKGAKIIPDKLLPLCEGLLIGGIQEGSLYPVYGIATKKGIKEYLCSIYWLLTEDEIKKFTDYSSLNGDELKIKE